MIVVDKAKKSVASNSKDKDSGFRKGDFVVYPTHGVGKILGVETQEVSGHSLQLIIIHFEKDRMTLRVPAQPAAEVLPISGARCITFASCCLIRCLDVAEAAQREEQNAQ